jgi:hypothetical protein
VDSNDHGAESFGDGAVEPDEAVEAEGEGRNRNQGSETPVPTPLAWQDRVRLIVDGRRWVGRHDRPILPPANRRGEN